jgi:hypothetical protein
VRRKLGFIIGLLGFAFAADAAFWVIATHRLAQAVGGFEEQLRALGWHVEAGAPVRMGWPFDAVLAVPSPSLQGGETLLPGGLSWRADRLLIGLSLLHPFTLRLLPQGHEELRLSRAPPVVFSADRLRALVPLGGARPSTLDIEAVSLVGGLASSTHKQDVRLGMLSLHLADRSPAGAATMLAGLDLQASELDLPDTRRWPLGARIGRMRLRADLASPPLAGRDAQDQARVWRDGGGSLAVQELVLRWGPLSADASATLGLDQRLQPEGTGQARLSGYDAALDALAGGGAISSGLAATAKAVLGLMAPGGGTGPLALPFTLQNSTLSVGKIPVVRLSDVVWKQP